MAIGGSSAEWNSGFSPLKATTTAVCNAIALKRNTRWYDAKKWNHETFSRYLQRKERGELWGVRVRR